jgi:hypothetical protein
LTFLDLRRNRALLHLLRWSSPTGNPPRLYSWAEDLFSSQLAAFADNPVDLLTSAVDVPQREVVREQAPLATALQEVEDGLEDPTKITGILGRSLPLGAGM